VSSPEPTDGSPSEREKLLSGVEAISVAPDVTHLRRLVRAVADWVDLELSLIYEALREVAPQANGRLLDVGCGSKPYESIFRPYVTEYIGIEHQATFALTNASSQELKADAFYDGNSLPFANESFDTVLSVQVLEHTVEPLELVREMARVMKKDGVLILLAPFSFRLHEEPHDYLRYSPHGLRVLCEKAGLEIVKVHQRGSLWSLMGHKLNSYLVFQVGNFGRFAQSIGKLGFEAPVRTAPRYWTLPLVAPAIVTTAFGARILDKLMHDPTETLGFLIVARRQRLPA
jgi:SAM-dependent methyltransferase